tara:strand:- start:2326 stop:3234 length:909 start_codon:yes stop_codon:yes gene_type:complete
MSREIKIDNHLDSNLRQLKIGEITAPIELATDKIRVNEKTTFAKDVVIDGDISIGGSTSDINLSDGVVLETTTLAGFLGVQAKGVAIYGTLYAGDGDSTDNDAKLSILASDGYDASISLYEASSVRWTVGNDADDSDKLKIDAGDAAVGGATKLTLDSSGNLSTAGTILSGWHGSTTRLKILPRDFEGNDDASRGAVWDEDAGGIRVSHPNDELYAFVSIPTGYTATAVMVYSNDASLNVEVHESDINVSFTSATSKGTGNPNTEIDITDVASDTTNYLVIQVDMAATSDLLYGGYVTITES